MILRVLRKDVDATGAAAGGGTALARDKYCPNRTESSNSGARGQGATARSHQSQVRLPTCDHLRLMICDL